MSPLPTVLCLVLLFCACPCALQASEAPPRLAEAMKANRQLGSESACAVVNQLLAFSPLAVPSLDPGQAWAWDARSGRDPHRPPRLIIIFDASASMRKHRQAIAAALSACHFGQLQVSGVGIAGDQLHSMDIGTGASLAQQLLAWRPGGQTLLGQALQQACQELTAQRPTPGGEGILFISDGEAADGALLAHLLPAARLAGIRLEALLIGRQRDELLKSACHKVVLTDGEHSQAHLEAMLADLRRYLSQPALAPGSPAPFTETDLQTAADKLAVTRNQDRFVAPANMRRRVDPIDDGMVIDAAITDHHLALGSLITLLVGTLAATGLLLGSLRKKSG